jgi:hypothetical protein
MALPFLFSVHILCMEKIDPKLNNTGMNISSDRPHLRFLLPLVRLINFGLSVG